ncbi:hypothetical protein EDB89DRAFT_1234161 [Lactarius sanguifluus]|nr:hypothetical protein EDB89DRAFT_1234161 [Lactarius sanguifluus]
MSTGNTGATLQLRPSRSVADTLTSYDDMHVLHDGCQWKQRPIMSCNVLHRRSGAICSWVDNQAFPSRFNTPSWAKSVPGPDAVTPSHGCQYQHFPYPSHRVIPYSCYPTRPVSYCPLSRFPVPRQGQCSLASLSPRWEDEPPIDEPQDRFPAPHLEKDASAGSFLAPGTGLFPASGLSNAFIPDGRQTSVSPASDSPIADIFPGSREELQLPDVWTRIHTPPSMTVQIDIQPTAQGRGSCHAVFRTVVHRR